MADFAIDIAQAQDLEAVVDIFARCRATCLPFIPVLHSRDEDLQFFRRSVTARQLLVARRGDAITGFMAVTPGWIEQLYLEPELRGQGMGRALVEHAKVEQHQLDLWCFAQNHPARAFYAALGFKEIGGTNGDNEAGLPDILFRWRRP